MLVHTMLSMMGDFGQLKFFVYLYLGLTAWARFRNDLNRKRVMNISIYAFLVLLLLEMARRYRMANVYDPDMDIEFMALSAWIMVSVVLAFWSALLLKKLSSKPYGWLYYKLRDSLRAAAAWIDQHANPSDLLRNMANEFERRAQDAHPMTQMATKISERNTKADIDDSVRRILEITEETS